MKPDTTMPEIQRKELARILWEARQVSLAAAKQIQHSFRGTGVPLNPKRGRLKP